MNAQLPIDILKFIDENFLESKLIYEKLELLIQYLDEHGVAESKDRILRCILYLAANNENLFTQYFEMAKLDYRDILYLAEYENEKQVRDFGKQF